VRLLHPDYNGRMWTVTNVVLSELNALYAHTDRPQTDYSSPAALHFWITYGAQMPLLAIIAQLALVTPMVTTVVENGFGVLGA
jgi:hypothetical protein